MLLDKTTTSPSRRTLETYTITCPIVIETCVLSATNKLIAPSDSCGPPGLKTCADIIGPYRI